MIAKASLKNPGFIINSNLAEIVPKQNRIQNKHMRINSSYSNMRENDQHNKNIWLGPDDL